MLLSIAGEVQGTSTDRSTAVRHRRTVVAGKRRLVQLGALLFFVLVLPFAARAQGSEDSSDATPALAANVTDNLSLGAFPASCPNLSTSFSLASVSSVTAESIVPYAPCTYTPSPYPPPAPPNDMWFRLNPAFSDAVYRFTLVGRCNAHDPRGAGPL